MAQNLTVSSVADLSALVGSKFGGDKETTVLYRGHGAESFHLIPKVGRLRPPASSKEPAMNESLMLELFRRQSVDRLAIATTDEWELLAIAQHHGMATRLLDWTRSPLAALFFSVWKEWEKRDGDGRPLCEDAEIIAWRSRKQDLAKPLPKCGPLKIKEVLRYIPRVVTPRLRAQSGVFTVHPNPRKDFEPDGELVRMRVPFKLRRGLKKALFQLGIHEAVLFPDLDSLARHIEWCQTGSCLSSGGKVQRVIIRHDDVAYAALFTSFIS